MGWVHHSIRHLTEHERALLAELLDRIDVDVQFGISQDQCRALQRVVEFDVQLDRILLLPRCPGLPEDQQPYLLQVSTSISIAFEECFTQGSVLLGAFPSDRVLVGFGLQEPEGGPSSVLEQWPLCYTWCGNEIGVTAVDRLPDATQAMPLFRSAFLRELASRFH